MTAEFTVMIRKRKSIFAQNLLVKFVQNVPPPPTLRRLRSDLTSKNMSMLQLERPGIESN